VTKLTAISKWRQLVAAGKVVPREGFLRLAGWHEAVAKGSTHDSRLRTVTETIS
jgi:hypothetical protein